MALAAVRSKAVVLWLWIIVLCTSHCLWGFCGGLCFGMHYFMSFLVCNHLDEEERACSFAIIIFRMSCYCQCSVALPHGAVGWPVVCECGIS